MEKTYKKATTAKVGMKERIAELETLLSEKENNENLIKESFTKEISRLKMALSDHEKTIKAQASEITKLTGSNKAYESEIETMTRYITALKERSLLERIFNKDVAL